MKKNKSKAKDRRIYEILRYENFGRYMTTESTISFVRDTVLEDLEIDKLDVVEYFLHFELCGGFRYIRKSNAVDKFKHINERSYEFRRED